MDGEAMAFPAYFSCDVSGLNGVALSHLCDFVWHENVSVCCAMVSVHVIDRVETSPASSSTRNTARVQLRIGVELVM